jgi:hypothetical protein
LPLEAHFAILIQGKAEQTLLRNRQEEERMGVWMDLLVAPQVPLLLEKERFLELVSELLIDELVALPCAVLGGAVSVDLPLGMANAAEFFPKESEEGVQVYYKGEDTVAFFKTLEAFPYGQSDLCVWFDCFNWQNPELKEDFQEEGYSNASILLYALTHPQTVICSDAGEVRGEYEVQSCFRTSGKNGPEDIVNTPLEPFLEHHFGSELIIDCAYS